MFHARDNLFFQRYQDGSVRILKLTLNATMTFNDVAQAKIPAHLIELDMTLDKNAWASIAASMSARGETGDTFYAALAFHQD